MKKVFTFLKKFLQPLMLAMVMSFILAGVVYFFGERVGAKGIYPFRDKETQTLASLGFLAIGTILLLIVLIRWFLAWREARRQREKREPTVEEREIAAMDKVFERSVAVIRNRWSGQSQGIYGLPWYLIIGKKDAGKTSIIENGDLRFPIDHEIRAELADIGDYDACKFLEWRVSGNEAVLLDIQGEFFVPHEERSSVQKVLWDRFLTNLQRIRPRRPVNGVVLAIDLMEFAGYTQSEREDYSALVRRTIDDLVERLGTRLTVHIILNKADQLAGFADYFENLSAVERETLFGFHFLYEGAHTAEWLDQFEKQYDEFLVALNSQVKRRLISLKNGRSQQEAFTFYRALMGLQAPLTAFLKSALQPDKFSTPPLVRGIYFASNRQENAPRNVFLEAVGQRYALAAPLYGTSQGASFPYFVTPFFKKAVFPEAGLAGNNQKVNERYRKNITIAFAASIALCLIGTIYWNSRYATNLAQADVVREKTQIFAQLNTSALADPTGQQLLEPLNTIREATFEFGDYKDVSPVVGQLTLYQGSRIGPIADSTYRRVLNTKFAPVLTKGVGDKLRNVCPKGSEEELEYLRVYRMLGDVSGRDDDLLRKHFAKLWHQNFEAQGEIQAQLNDHFGYMLETTPQSYEIDENLIISAQNNLGGLTPYRRVYSSLKSDAERQMANPIDLESSIGANFGLVYEAETVGELPDDGPLGSTINDSYSACGQVTEQIFERGPFEIPRLFTAREFRDFFIPQNEAVAKISARDFWVLGQLENANYSEADYANIRDKVREIYTDDYIRIWRQTLNTMRVRPFDDMRDATEVLRALSSSENPVRRVAQLVAENTEIYEAEGIVTEESATTLDSELPIDPDRAAGLLIYDSFGEIRRMLEDKPEGGQPGIDQIEAALIAVYDYMKTIRDAPNPNAKALEAAIKRAELVGEDPIYVLQRIAERTPAPFDAHLKHVASESWRIVMVGATEELNRKWHDEIYGDYQRLIAGKYPFNRASSVDLPVEDFEEFFRPGGILENFYEKELLVFVDQTTGNPRIIDGQALALDINFAADLRKAIDITKSFFDASGELAVEFNVQTVRMSANLSRAILNFEGQVVINSHGPTKPVSIIWPNLVDQGASSRIDIAPLFGTGRPYARQFDGPWSWLRLYDSASKSNFQNNSVDVTFGNENGQTATFRIRPEARVNPFFNSPLSNFELPSHLRSKGS